VAEVLRRHWREVIWTALLRTGQQTPFYIFTAYVLTYATERLALPRGHVLNLVLGSSAISLFSIPLFGWLSDRVGHRRLIAVGCLAMLVWPFAYFGLLDTRIGLAVAAAVLLAQPIQDLQYAPQAAVIADAFPPQLRYSGSSLGYQLASLTAGGPAPIVALWLMQRTGHSLSIAAYLSATAAISLLALWALSRRSRADRSAGRGRFRA
jgi:MFS family permease